MKLRPHHLLCTLGYVGLGYNEDFVKNMDYITSQLKNNSLKIKLEITTDDICTYCPKKIKKNLCLENDSVVSYDKKVLEVFHLQEKEYLYQELLAKIKEFVTEDKLNYICGDCSWFLDCATRKKLCKKN